LVSSAHLSLLQLQLLSQLPIDIDQLFAFLCGC
jgi:hypothetical protein